MPASRSSPSSMQKMFVARAEALLRASIEAVGTRRARKPHWALLLSFWVPIGNELLGAYATTPRQVEFTTGPAAEGKARVGAISRRPAWPRHATTEPVGDWLSPFTVISNHRSLSRWSDQ